MFMNARADNSKSLTIYSYSYFPFIHSIWDASSTYSQYYQRKSLKSIFLTIQGTSRTLHCRITVLIKIPYNESQISATKFKIIRYSPKTVFLITNDRLFQSTMPNWIYSIHKGLMGGQKKKGLAENQFT